MTKPEDRERQIAEVVLERIGIDGDSSEHQVIIGPDEASNQRVLQGIEDSVRHDPELYTRRYGVRIGNNNDKPTSLAGLWAQAVEEMMPHCENQSLRTMGRQAVQDWEARERPAREAGLEALALTITATRSERTVLLVDRLDELLGHLEERDYERLHKILDAEPSVIMIGTATELDDDTDPERSLFRGMTVQRNSPDD